MDAPDRLNKVIEKEKIRCLRDIVHMITQSKLLTDKLRIVSISPITKQEASKLHLMALTDSRLPTVLQCYGIRDHISTDHSPTWHPKTCRYNSSNSRRARPRDGRDCFLDWSARRVGGRYEIYHTHGKPTRYPLCSRFLLGLCEQREQCSSS